MGEREGELGADFSSIDLPKSAITVWANFSDLGKNSLIGIVIVSRDHSQADGAGLRDVVVGDFHDDVDILYRGAFCLSLNEARYIDKGKLRS